MSRTLDGLEDILVFGKDECEHQERLITILQRIKKAGITLNKEKCEIGKTELKFLSHVIDQNGIKAEPEKVQAIQEMRPPENVSDLRRFIGMINQLGKFSPKLSELSQPLSGWGPSQDSAFSSIKAELSKPTTLLLNDPAKETKVSADIRLFTWSGYSTNAEGYRYLETSGICIQVLDYH